MAPLHAMLPFSRPAVRGAIASLMMLVASSASVRAAQVSWTPGGPDGGDARALAAVPGQPRHLYLGTTNSLIYESIDEGANWRRLAKLDSSDDLVIDNILVDPANASNLFAAAWKFDHPDGGLWMSSDAGKTWQENPGLHGQSIRAFAPAPSDRRRVFPGSLHGGL